MFALRQMLALKEVWEVFYALPIQKAQQIQHGHHRHDLPIELVADDLLFLLAPYDVLNIVIAARRMDIIEMIWTILLGRHGDSSRSQSNRSER